MMQNHNFSWFAVVTVELEITIWAALKINEIDLHPGERLLGQDGFYYDTLFDPSLFVGAGFTTSKQGHNYFLGDIRKLLWNLLLHNVPSSMALLNMELMEFIKKLLIMQESLHRPRFVELRHHSDINFCE